MAGDDRKPSKAAGKSPSRAAGKSPSKAAGKSPSKADIRSHSKADMKSPKADDRKRSTAALDASMRSAGSAVSDDASIRSKAAPAPAPAPPPPPPKNKNVPIAVAIIVLVIIIIVAVVLASSGGGESDSVQEGKFKESDDEREPSYDDADDEPESPESPESPDEEAESPDDEAESDGEPQSAEEKKEDAEKKDIEGSGSGEEAAAGPAVVGDAKVQSGGPYPDCLAKLAEADGIAESGVYSLKLDGLDAKDARCDMKTLGGGWTVIQTRVEDDTDFYMDYSKYEEGFGDPSTSYWFGLKYIHAVTFNETNTLLITMKTETETKKAIYKSVTIMPAAKNYRLLVGNFDDTSTVPDKLYLNNEMDFTTHDRDNDKYTDDNCGSFERHKGGFWYASCGEVNLNGAFGTGQGDTRGVFWGKEYITESSMKVRRRSCTSNPCKNEGTCKDNHLRFVCTCTSGFEGDRCEVNKDECSSRPCVYKEDCTDMANGYECTCKGERDLNVCEGELKNVALIRPVYQSSAKPRSYRHLAVDGIVNHKVSRKCIHTLADIKPWWRVELFKEYPICQINIKGYRSSFMNLIIRVGTNKDHTENEICTRHDYLTPDGTFKELTCDKPLKGNIVSFEIESYQSISLCEVQVMSPVC